MNPVNTTVGLLRAEPLVLADALGHNAAAFGDPEQGIVLIGRPFGKSVRPTIEAAIEALPPRTVLPIDCTGVRMVDASFGDEVFVRLARLRASGQFPERYFVLTGVGEEMEENLDLVCRMKGVVLVFQRGLLGDVGAELKATYDIAAEEGALTSRRLIERVGADRLALTASSNRLSRLEELGILAPVDADGRQKVYAPVR